jgi:hypothetical protein
MPVLSALTGHFVGYSLVTTEEHRFISCVTGAPRTLLQMDRVESEQLSKSPRMIHDLQELRIHIGAHKTATTHVQDVLAANRSLLAEQGIDYLPREQFRSARLIRAMYENFRLPYHQRRTFAEIVSPLRTIGPKLVISEENILGMSFNLLNGLYPRATKRLSWWSEAINQETTFLFLSIRNHADILPSAYSQALRDGAIVAPIRQYIDYWLHVKPRWSHLTSRLRQQFPKPTFKVWTLDDYIGDNARVLSRLSGTQQLSFLDLPIPKTTTTLSLEVINRIRRLPAELPRQVRMQRITRILMTYPGGEPFSPLTTTDRTILNDNYHKDLDLIHSMGVLI